MVLLGLVGQPIVAQAQSSNWVSPASKGQTVAQNPAISGWLFVNPHSGNDSSGNGSEAAPFKTISRALSLARPNTAISLAPGTYSEQTGETFPLKLKPDVWLQGNPDTKGQQIVISGGGGFVSPTFARQNVAILGADRAGLSGITVTNQNPRGYGLWVESTHPVVTNNTFTNNTHDGISVVGNGSPLIQENHFSRNGANGITIYGSSRAEVRQNVFEQTGFGINVAQKAAPLLVDNRIIRNKDGVVLQARTRPVLRGNEIAENERDGLVAIANSQPDLGTATDPGKNQFRNNGRFDLNAKATSETIPAFGNQLTSARTQGEIDFSGTTALVAAAPPVRPAVLPTALADVAKRAPQTATIDPVAERSAIAISIPSPERSNPLPPAPSSTPTASWRLTPSQSAEATAIRATASRAADKPQTGSKLTTQSHTMQRQTVSTERPGPRNSASSPKAATVARRTRTAASSRTATAASRATSVTTIAPKQTEAASDTGASNINAASFPVPSSLRPQPAAALPKPEAPSTPVTPIAPKPVLVRQSRSVTPVMTTAPTPSAAPNLTGQRSLPQPPAVKQVPSRNSTRTVAATRQQSAPLAVAPPRRQPLATQPASSARRRAASSANNGVIIPVPPPESRAIAPTSSRGFVNPIRIQPPAGSNANPTGWSAAINRNQNRNQALLPVPGPDIPIGNGGSVSRTLKRNPLDGSPPGPPLRASAVGNYRVLVETGSLHQENRVRSLVPRAFRTTANGRAVMQAGVFGSRSNAEKMRRLLLQNGLRATVESF